MRISDISILARKILVGIGIYLVPVSIILGGLSLVRHILADPPAEEQSIAPAGKTDFAKDKNEPLNLQQP